MAPFTRRDVLRAGLTGLAALGMRRLARGAGRRRGKPNVLFISVDDMNDWVGHLGGYRGKIHTPSLDRLARRGVAFTNAHCPAPVCNPSRTAILTGLRPSTTGVYHNGHWWRPHLPDTVTLPEHFKANGYLTVGGGKVYHHVLGFNPLEQWDHFEPQVQDGSWHFDYPVPGQHAAKPGLHWPKGFPLHGIESVAKGQRPPMNYREFDWGPFDKPDLAMGDGRMVQWALDVLARRHERPFFLAAGIYRPHLPWYAPRKYFDLYPLDQIKLPPRRQDDLDDVPPAGRKMAAQRRMDFELIQREGKYREAVQAYLASISFADALVGRLLDALDASPHAKNTIVVLWSDHGWHLGEKGTWHKMTLWERGTHVPFIIAAPGLAAGVRCGRPVGLVNIYPTLIELCDLPRRPELDGVSLMPLLRDPAARWERPALMTYRRGNHAIRDARWRYIRYANGDEELYDLQADPNEWTNLAGAPQHAAVKQRLARWLPKADAPDAPGKRAYHFDPKTYTWRRKRKP